MRVALHGGARCPTIALRHAPHGPAGSTAMVGPVLYLEMLLGGRRGRQLIFRYLYVGWLVLQFGFFWFGYIMDVQNQRSPYGLATPDPNVTSRFATNF